MKTQFNVNIPDDMPMADTEFYQWLDSNVSKPREMTKIELINPWLIAKGFNKEQQYIEKNDFQSLEYIANHFVNMWVPNKTRFKLSDLFYLDESGPWYIQGCEYRGSERPSLDAILKDIDVIYSEKTPADFYFKIINDRLYLCYQQIIGSRLVAYLEKKDGRVRK